MVYLIKYVFNSKNKEVYRLIANEHKTTARRVYMLAHGKKAKSNKDYNIQKSLKEHNIIEGVVRG